MLTFHNQNNHTISIQKSLHKLSRSLFLFKNATFSSSTNTRFFTPQHRTKKTIHARLRRFLWTVRTSRREIGHLTTCITPTLARKIPPKKSSKFGSFWLHPIHPVTAGVVSSFWRCQVNKKNYDRKFRWCLFFHLGICCCSFVGPCTKDNVAGSGKNECKILGKNVVISTLYILKAKKSCTIIKIIFIPNQINPPTPQTN